MGTLTFDHAKALAYLKQRKWELQTECSRMLAEIASIDQAIGEYEPIAEGGWSGWTTPDAGFTDSIRGIFRKNSSNDFSPVELRDRLLGSGMVLAQRNPMAAIHQILSRLVKSAEIRGVRDRDGKMRYRAV